MHPTRPEICIVGDATWSYITDTDTDADTGRDRDTDREEENAASIQSTSKYCSVYITRRRGYKCILILISTDIYTLCRCASDEKNHTKNKRQEELPCRIIYKGFVMFV